MVSNNISSIKTFEELRRYVYATLCDDHELLSDAFPTSEAAIRRNNGDACGMMFCVHGPRSVNFTAIWEKQKNRVFFYGPLGERYRQTTLDGSAELVEAAEENEN
ncbi:MAG: hypothetical protein IKU86_08885 [Thermoguttaceae bacterium]|nr:hypothetical protein [Thermoguttaceae bacterium]